MRLQPAHGVALGVAAVGTTGGAGRGGSEQRSLFDDALQRSEARRNFANYSYPPAISSYGFGQQQQQQQPYHVQYHQQYQIQQQPARALEGSALSAECAVALAHEFVRVTKGYTRDGVNLAQFARESDPKMLVPFFGPDLERGELVMLAIKKALYDVPDSSTRFVRLPELMNLVEECTGVSLQTHVDWDWDEWLRTLQTGRARQQPGVTLMLPDVMRLRRQHSGRDTAATDEEEKAMLKAFLTAQSPEYGTASAATTTTATTLPVPVALAGQRREEKEERMTIEPRRESIGPSSATAAAKAAASAPAPVRASAVPPASDMATGTPLFSSTQAPVFASVSFRQKQQRQQQWLSSDRRYREQTSRVNERIAARQRQRQQAAVQRAMPLLQRQERGEPMPIEEELAQYKEEDMQYESAQNRVTAALFRQLPAGLEEAMAAAEEEEEEEGWEQEDVHAARQLRLQQLSQEEEDRVADALRTDGNPRELLSLHGGIDMTRDKMVRLRAGEWLNDEVVNFYMLLLQERDRRLCAADPSRKPSHYFNSFFVTKLLDDARNQYNYRNVRRWSRKFDVFGMRKIFCPVNIANTHWTLAVIDMDNRCISYHDSMHGGGERYLNHLLHWLQDEMVDKKKSELDPTEWTIEPCTSTNNSSPQQNNGVDCGVFTIMTADFLSDDLTPALCYSQRDIPFFRRKVCLDILDKTLKY